MSDTENFNKVNRDVLLKDLREGVMDVSFTKEDGTNRVMRCTLKRQYLPAKYLEEETEERAYHKSNPDLLAVWDVQNKGWRSFHISSIQYVQLVDGY